MDDMITTVHQLAQGIGPRPPTSAAEAQASAYVNSRMRQAGLDVDMQSFRAVPTSSLPHGLICLAFVLVPLVARFSPPAALVLSLVALAAFIAETLSFPLLSRWISWGRSQNIIGTRPPTQDARQHLIVLAHLDTARASLLSHPRVVGSSRLLFLIGLGAMLLLPILVSLSWWTESSWLWAAQLVPAGWLALGLLLIIHREIWMPQVHGANDNASGVAVLLHLAHELDNLQHTAVWFAATGSKESGLQGARHFLAQYPFPRRHSYIINLDTVGQGRLSVIVDEGMLAAHQADPHLVALAMQANASGVAINLKRRSYHGMSTDAQVALVRGFRAMSLMAFEDGQLPNWHWPSDTVEQVDPELLDQAARLVSGIAQLLDGRAATEVSGPAETAAAEPPQPDPQAFPSIPTEQS